MPTRRFLAVVTVAALAGAAAAWLLGPRGRTGGPEEGGRSAKPGQGAASLEGASAGPQLHAFPGGARKGLPDARPTADRPPLPVRKHRFTVSAEGGQPVGPTRLILRFAPPAAGGAVETRDLLVPDGEALTDAETDLVSLDAHPVDPGSPPLLARIGIVPPTGARDHAIVLARGAWLRLRVLLPDGTPLPGAGLLVRGADAPDLHLRSDAEGRVSGAVAADGTYAVELDGLLVQVEAGSVRVGPSPWHAVIRGVSPGDDLRLVAHALPRAALRVRVLAPDRRPVAGASVRIHVRNVEPPCAEAATDASGEAVLADLPCRPYRVVLVPPSGGAATARLVPPPPVTAVPGEGPVELELLPARTVSGRVRDMNGAPCPRARVLLLHQGSEVAAVASDERGDFTFALPEGRTGPFTVEARVWLPGGGGLEGAREDVWATGAQVEVVVAPPP